MNYNTSKAAYADYSDGREYGEELMTNIFEKVGMGLKYYVRAVDTINEWVGKFAMYLLLMLLGILTYSIVTNAFNSPSIWVMEMAQFTMAAYYLLGGGYSLKHKMHVRMDFLYERWSVRKRAMIDCFTIFFVIFFLVVLVKGGWDSSAYALEFGQRNNTVWGPSLAPIKIIMTIGMFLMLLQCFAELIKDATLLLEGDAE